MCGKEVASYDFREGWFAAAGLTLKENVCVFWEVEGGDDLLHLRHIFLIKQQKLFLSFNIGISCNSAHIIHISIL